MKATLALLVQGIHVISPVKFIVKVNTQVFVFCKPSLFPNPGCTLVRSVVSSIRNWSPSSLYYRCLYAVKVVDDPPIYLFIPFRHTSNDGELLEVTIHSSVCEELWKWRTSYLTKVNIKENRSLNTDVYGKPPHDQYSLDTPTEFKKPATPLELVRKLERLQKKLKQVQLPMIQYSYLPKKCQNQWLPLRQQHRETFHLKKAEFLCFFLLTNQIT